jgi:hypothetical protein
MGHLEPSQIKLNAKVGNFILTKRIESLQELMNVFETDKSIFWKHRVYPVAFVQNQTLPVLKNSIKYNCLYTIKRVKRNENS